MFSGVLEKVDSGRNGTGERPATRRLYTPRVDLVETDEDLILYADLPGVKPADVALDRKGNELILQARCEQRAYGARPLHSEYGVGDFYRSFTIPADVDCDRIEATLTDGVLTVQVPKAEAVRPKRIAVKAR